MKCCRRRLAAPLFVALLPLLAVSACGGGGSSTPAAAATPPAATTPNPQVTLTTTLGTVVIELEPGVAPATVDNFLAYTRSGFYDGTLFHRVVPGFVNQGGAFTAVDSGGLLSRPGARAPIALESNRGLSNVRGTVAMARTDVFDSATSQFFVNVVDNSRTLDHISAAAPGYAVFGRVVAGIEVMDALNAVPTRSVAGFANVPVTNVFVTSARQTR